MSSSQNSSETVVKRKAPPRAWRPGESGNPGGRPRKTPDEMALVEACRAKAPEAMRVLASLMKAADKDSVRLQAALAILERGFGRPLQRQEQGAPGSFEKHATREELERSIVERGAKLGFRIVPPKRTGTEG